MVSIVASARPIEKERIVIVELRVQKIAQGPDDELCIFTEGNKGDENLKIIFRFPKAKIERWSGGKGRYRFPAFLDPATEETKRLLDEVLTRKFGAGEHRSLFKPRGYIADCLKLPEEFGKKGGQIALIDPGLDDGGGWYIKIQYNPGDNSLILEISELRA
jgi:hypothetical protein